MRNRVLSRRQKAIRSVLVVVGIFLGVHILGIYHHTPGVAQRELERRMGLGDCEELDSRWSWNRDGLYLSTQAALTRMTLAANDEALMLTRQTHHPMKGWSAEVVAWLPLEKPDPLWLDVTQREQADRIYEAANGLIWYSAKEGYEKMADCWLYGTVSDPGITELKLRARHGAWGRVAYVDGVAIDASDPRDTTVTVTEFIECQGQRIFFQPIKVPADHEIRSVWLVTEDGEECIYG